MARYCGAGEVFATVADEERSLGMRTDTSMAAMMAAQRSCHLLQSVRAFRPAGPFADDAESLTAHAAARLRSLIADLTKYLHSPDLTVAVPAAKIWMIPFLTKASPARGQVQWERSGAYLAT